MIKKIILTLMLAVMVFTLAMPALADENVFQFDKTITTLFVGESLQTELQRAGNGANGDVAYTSSAYKVATVDDNGVVTGLKPGTTTITARAGKYKATIRLTVAKAVETMELDTEKIIVFPQEHPAINMAVVQIPEDVTPVLIMREKQSRTFGVKVTPEDATSKKFTVSTSDEEILKIKGTSVTALSVGECWVTLTSVQNPEVSVQYRLLVVEPVTSVKVTAEKKEIFIGEQVALSTTVKPVEATIQTFEWVSSNEAVATVDEFGVVTGHKKGTAYITAEAMDGSKVENRIKITVEQQPASISLKQDSVIVNMGSTKKLEATVLPDNTNNKKAVWTSSNESIAKVSSSGKVTPVAPGTCIITASCEEFPEIRTACQVTVQQPVTKVEFDSSSIMCDAGSYAQLRWTTSPAYATNHAVTFASSKESVATVSPDGVIYGHKKGSATITVYAADGSGKKDTISVTIAQPVEGLTLKENNVTVNVGSTKTLKATISPSNANNQKVTWFSSNESVAKVSSSGKITPVAPGNCTITCTSQANPGIYAVCQVTVLQPVKKVVFSGNSATLDVGSVKQLTWSVEPYNASNPAVTFKSSNEKVATVDNNGLVYGVKRGSATITATATDGSKKKDTITVHVLQPVLGVHMQEELLNVGVGESIRARAVLEPEDASNTNMTWYSSDPAIATVRGTNTRPTIAGKRWGTVTITGITEDGNYQTNCIVDVGDYDYAMRISDLYLLDNEIKITSYNESNMNISRFYVTFEVYDIYDQPLPCTKTGNHIFRASHAYRLLEGESTRRGTYTFYDYVQPEQAIGHVIAYITEYTTEDGYNHKIRYEDKLEKKEYLSPLYLGPDALPHPEVPEVPEVPAG